MTQSSDDRMDPFAAWRGMRDANMEALSRAMVDMVNTEAFAQAIGTYLDTYLAASAPFRRSLETTMSQVLAQLNMPSRTEVVSIAERLTNIEMRLDDLDAKIDALMPTDPEER